MALLENSIFVDLDEGSFFELSQAGQEALAPPAELAASFEIRPGQRGAPDQNESAKEEEEEEFHLHLEDKSVVDEMRTVLSAARQLATPPSDRALQMARQLLEDASSSEVSA